MSFGKVLAFVLLGLLSIYLLCCALGPKDLNVERSTLMDASPEVVFEQVNELRNWEKWSPWAAKDPDIKLSYANLSAGTNGKYSWDGPVVGKGSLEILQSTPPKSLKTKLLIDGFDGESYGSWSFEPEKDGTKVTWGMDGDNLPFMLRGMMMIMGQKKAMIQDFDQGLANIKTLVEG